MISHGGLLDHRDYWPSFFMRRLYFPNLSSGENLGGMSGSTTEPHSGQESWSVYRPHEQRRMRLFTLPHPFLVKLASPSRERIRSTPTSEAILMASSAVL